MVCIEYKLETVSTVSGRCWSLFVCLLRGGEGLYFASKAFSTQLASKAWALPRIPPDDVKPNYSRNCARRSVVCKDVKRELRETVRFRAYFSIVDFSRTWAEKRKKGIYVWQIAQSTPYYTRESFCRGCHLQLLLIPVLAACQTGCQIW